MYYYKIYITGADEKAGDYESVEANAPLEACKIALKRRGLPENGKVWRIVRDKEMNELALKRESKKMAAKKDFTANTRNKVLSSIAEATQEASQIQEDPHVKKERKTYTEQEAQEFQNTLQTSGHKGVKLPRINMGFTPEIHDYIKTMARVQGKTITEFVNAEMKKSLEANKETYSAAKKFLETL